MLPRTPVIATATLVAAMIAVGVAAARTDTSTTLHLAIAWSGSDAACPQGYSGTTACHPHVADRPVAVAGFGFVSESYVFAVETADGCPPGFQQALSYPARLSVRGQGEIFIAVAAAPQCGEMGVPLLSTPQTFAITGGSGVFAGASGGGVVTRTNAGCCPATAIDHWDGTIAAPGLVIDLTAPTISGAKDIVVRAPRYRIVHISPRKTKRRLVKSVRVKFKVTASDDVDGSVPVTCKPRSNSSFRVGRTSTVACSATDKSANTATGQFKVRVKYR